MHTQRQIAEEMFTKKLGWNERAAHGAIIKVKKTHTIFITKLEDAYGHREYITPDMMKVIIDVFKNKGLFVKIEEDKYIKPLDYHRDFEVWSAMSEGIRKTYAITQLL
jgi:hypothetical protein